MIYRFIRYRRGVEMAEGACVTRAKSEAEALDVAKRLFWDDRSADKDVFVLDKRDDAALAEIGRKLPRG